MPLLVFCREFKSRFANILRRMAEALDSFEPNQNGFIQQEFLEGEIQLGLNEINQLLTDQLTYEANNMMDSVSDIFRLPHLDDSEVQESIRDAGKRRDNTIDGLIEFDLSQTGALVSVENDLSTMESRISDLETMMTEGLTVVGFPVELWKAVNVRDPLNLSLGAGNQSLKGLSGVTSIDRPGSINGANPYTLPGMYTYAIPLYPMGITGADVSTTPVIKTDLGESITTELTCSVPPKIEKVEDDGSWIDWLLSGISFTLDVIPVVSNIKSGIESFTGKDLITQREFSTIERAIVAASILGGPISKGVTKIGKVGVELASNGAKQIPKYADILANQYNKMKHVVNPAKIQTAIDYAFKQTTKAVQYGKRHVEAFAQKILDQPIIFGPQLVIANGAIPSKTVRDVLADGKESIHTMAKKVEDKVAGGKVETNDKSAKVEQSVKGLNIKDMYIAELDIDIPVAKGEMPWGPGNIAKGIKAIGKGPLSKVLDGKAGKNVDSVSANKGTGNDVKKAKDISDNIINDGSHISKGGKLKPNVKYQAGEFDYQYKTDKLGRISEFNAEDLKLTKRNNRLPHKSNTLGKEPGDHAGHIAADRFGGSPDYDNLVSQSSNVNLSQYKRLENQWANAIKDRKKVSINVKVNYDDIDLRPTSFEVKYDIDGVIKKRVLKN